MKITLIDGNNWFRRRVEADHTGRAISNCFYEIQNMPTYPIIVWDGFKSLEKRRAIFPDYKKSRKPAGESIFESQNTLIKVLKLGKGVSVRVDGYEADDVIAHLCRDLQVKGHEINIESNDADFAQLGVPLARSQFPIPPRWVALYKTVVGDPSDNIKGAKGFGKGTFEKFNDKDLQLLEAVIVSYSKESEERVSEHLDKLPIPKAVHTWMQSKENRKLLLDYHKIVNFIPMTDEIVSAGTTINSKTPELAQEVFEEFML